MMMMMMIILLLIMIMIIIIIIMIRLDVHGGQHVAELLGRPVPLVELLQDDHTRVVHVHPGAEHHEGLLLLVVRVRVLLGLMLYYLIV